MALLADQFLLEKGLIVRNVSSYGLEDSLRISIGTDKNCESVINGLTEFQEIHHVI